MQALLLRYSAVLISQTVNYILAFACFCLAIMPMSYISSEAFSSCAFACMDFYIHLKMLIIKRGAKEMQMASNIIHLYILVMMPLDISL